ncbi:hypothetical protein N0V90_011047 [Kalmusia sp. IMI 367209]|nr:hypothetical protein N0V90_011047 [Kalmusia sp. IMI 367209]
MKASFVVGALAAIASAGVIDIEARGGYGHGGGYDGGHADKCKKLPPVNSRKLQAAIHTDSLLKGAKKLMSFAESTPARNRQMGTRGHNLTTDFLIKELKKLNGYYKIQTQTFWDPVMLNGTLSLEIDGEATDGGLFDYSASGDVSAPLVVVSNQGCEAGDYPAEVSGNIALILRGSCEFGLKSALAGAAGAQGALIYNNIQGRLEGTLSLPGRPEGDYIPTIGLSDVQGQNLVAAITSGAEVTASLHVETDIQNRSTINVLATSNCGSTDTVLMLGAHTDSVFRGPGINDDGSGTIGILEVAKALSKYKVNNAVRFGWWSGEEIGTLGSEYYVDSLSTAEQAKVRAYLNFDMIASPNYVHAIYDGDGSSFNSSGPTGSAEIEHFFERYFASKGENYTATEFDGRSDYGAFLEVGIPSGGTFTGAEDIKTEEEAVQFGGIAGEPYDANYHQAGDDVSNLALDAFTLHAKGIAAAVAEYATSFKSLPPKDTAKRDMPMTRSEAARSVGDHAVKV